MYDLMDLINLIKLVVDYKIFKAEEYDAIIILERSNNEDILTSTRLN